MSEDNDGDNDNSNNDDNADWRQVTKGRRAVTHTDERRVTPVRNQFQELSEQQDASDTGSTPRLALRELTAFSQLPPEENYNDTVPNSEGTKIHDARSHST